MRKNEIPQFGLLAGVKVVHSSTVVAGPIAAELMAENGADVIWIESPRALDTNRGKSGMGAESERRNMRNISFDVFSAEGREVLKGLVSDADIFMESSKGGTWAKHGITDEVLWEWNPKLVIAHFSGYGQTGDPSYVTRGCYDPVCQAFSGLMNMQGFPDREPPAAREVPTDYFAGLTGFGMCMAGVLKARETGKGESFDIAQFETAMRYQNQRPMDWFNRGAKALRVGSHNEVTAAWGAYTCKDGNGVYLMFLGPSVMKKGLPLFGWEFGSELFPATQNFAPLATEGGKMLEDAVSNFCATHTAKEVEDALGELGVPCSRIMDYEMAAEHPHYIARNTFMEWDAVDGRRLKGVSPMPKISNNPQQIWRGCPTPGMDTDDILRDLGYDEERISQLHSEGILRNN